MDWNGVRAESVDRQYIENHIWFAFDRQSRVTEHDPRTRLCRGEKTKECRVLRHTRDERIDLVKRPCFVGASVRRGGTGSKSNNSNSPRRRAPGARREQGTK